MKFADRYPELYQNVIVPFGMVLAGLIVVSLIGAGLSAIRPPPGQEFFIPREWSCHSKYQGGYCERTGGYDRNGRPWGTAAPPPSGPRPRNAR